MFAYGTLVAPECLDEVLGHKHFGERLAARLEGFRRVESSTYEYPYIVPAVGHAVDGVLLMDLSPDEVQTLDRYEEVGAGVYRRETVDVTAFGCGSQPARITAVAYVAGEALEVRPTSRFSAQNAVGRTSCDCLRLGPD